MKIAVGVPLPDRTKGIETRMFKILKRHAHYSLSAWKSLCEAIYLHVPFFSEMGTWNINYFNHNRNVKEKDIHD